MLYFLTEDLDLLEQKIEETVTRLREVGEELRTATSQSSETWHDNFGFENAQQQARMLSQRIDDLEQVRRNAITVLWPKEHEKIAIGHTIIAKDLKTGAMKTFRIGSHITFTADTISYSSPIGSLLLNKKVGEKIIGTVGEKEFKFEIIQIT